jgi:hypothetical protein
MYKQKEPIDLKKHFFQDQSDIFAHFRDFLTIDERLRINDIQKIKPPFQNPTANVNMEVTCDEEIDIINSNIITKKVLWVIRFPNGTQIVYKLIRQQGKSDNVYFLSYLIANNQNYFDSFCKVDMEGPEHSSYFRLCNSLFTIFPPII